MCVLGVTESVCIWVGVKSTDVLLSAHPSADGSVWKKARV